MGLLKSTFVGTALAITLCTSVAAQTYSVGTNPQGSLAYATGSAISKVAIEQADIRMRVVPQGGPTVVVPLVNAGELEFSVANGVASAFAYSGGSEFPSPNESIRVAAVLFNLYEGWMVRADSDIKSLKDLKGKRAASVFIKQAIVETNAAGVLNTVGLSYDDLDAVPVPNGVRGVEDFEAGNVDATFFSLSSGRTKQAGAAVGGLRILPVEISDDANEKLAEIAPGSWISEIEPGPNFPGVMGPIGAYTTPFVVLTSTHTPDDVVYKLVKAIHENKDALAASAGAFNAFDPAKMNTPIGVPFHPGAKKFYAEIGM